MLVSFLLMEKMHLYNILRHMNHYSVAVLIPFLNEIFSMDIYEKLPHGFEIMQTR